MNNKMSARADIYQGFCHFYWLQSCMKHDAFIVDDKNQKIKGLQALD
ncbi:MAG: hypothetical protein ACKPE3_02395 [Sphaerospermopsis kisseleviana]|jgi:hypothetical protein|uniref:Uncharacterized protein n=1 Tax=Sphaerospermopsis reniformis TaxID=531300 RepID=A0A480AAC6_9CYAN|nr:hypothetical protein [Sphaerospermopsis sp. FACHB-1094]MBD2132502.1 hypothetical protein [Sphaerospermopsis sp. FACHB-1094]GCL40101.1 hypothetical protein SR1949_52350 [Sphaerospermopsis reniformis]